MRSRMLPLLGLSLSLVLAGCAAPAGTEGSKLDTGELAPGEERTLTFGTTDVTLHCHPHPFMVQEVQISPDGVASAHVHILDGATEEEFRFEPSTLVVAPGANVTYHNHGALVHTATTGAGHGPAH